MMPGDTIINVQAGAVLNLFYEGATNQQQGLTKGYLDAAISKALVPTTDRITTMEATFERELQEMKDATAAAVTAMTSAVAVMGQSAQALPALKDAVDAAVNAAQNAGASTTELVAAAGQLDTLQQAMAPAAKSLVDAAALLDAILNPPAPSPSPAPPVIG